MLHYTLNTGHTRVSPRTEVSDDVIPVVLPLLEPGEHDMPGPPGYILKVPIVPMGWFGTVYSDGGTRPICSIAVAANDKEAEELWPQVEKHYYSITEVPHIRAADFQAGHRPEKTPWCADVLIFGTPDELYWIADFARCLAWAYVESKQ